MFGKNSITCLSYFWQEAAQAKENGCPAFFRQDAKFQDFIDQVTRARGLLLEMGAGMEKLKEAGV